MCTSRVNGLRWPLLFCLNRHVVLCDKISVLPQSALARGIANTELHLKPWSCCPRHALCQGAPRTTRQYEGGRFFFYFLLFLLPERLQASWQFTVSLSYCGIFFFFLPLIAFISPSFVSTSVTSASVAWKFVANVPPTLHIPGSYMLVALSLSLCHQCNLCGCWA